jgi:SnoaL-like protein
VPLSPKNVELLRASIEAFRAGTSESDREGMLTKIAELWDPDIEMDTSEVPVLDISGIYRGKEAVRQFWREWLAAWEALQFEYELIDAGNRVVQLIDLRMRGRSTGIEMPFGKVAWAYTFRDGLIVHQKLYMSQSEALEAPAPGDRRLLRSVGHGGLGPRPCCPAPSYSALERWAVKDSNLQPWD